MSARLDRLSKTLFLYLVKRFHFSLPLFSNKFFSLFIPFIWPPPHFFSLPPPLGKLFSNIFFVCAGSFPPPLLSLLLENSPTVPGPVSFDYRCPQNIHSISIFHTMASPQFPFVCPSEEVCHCRTRREWWMYRSVRSETKFIRIAFRHFFPSALTIFFNPLFFTFWLL